jgi:hypothetical protein
MLSLHDLSFPLNHRLYFYVKLESIENSRFDPDHPSRLIPSQQFIDYNLSPKTAYKLLLNVCSPSRFEILLIPIEQPVT